MVFCEKAGIEFEDQLVFWETPPLRCLGTATRQKKVMAMNLQVYACAFYVDEDAALAALRANGAVSEQARTLDGMADVLLHGPFRKVLFVRMTRTVTGGQFIGAMLEAATPRLGGNCAQELAQLKKAFNMSLKAGDTFLMSTDGRAHVSFSHFKAGTVDFSKPQPLLAINHELFTHALFDIYLGRQALMPDARKNWVVQFSRHLTGKAPV